MINEILNLFKKKCIHDYSLIKEGIFEGFGEVYKVSEYKCRCGEIKKTTQYLSDSEVDIYIRNEKFKKLGL